MEQSDSFRRGPELKITQLFTHENEICPVCISRYRCNLVTEDDETCFHPRSDSGRLDTSYSWTMQPAWQKGLQQLHKWREPDR
jgi:hypothetical protein